MKMKMYETCDTLSPEFEGLRVEAANEDEAMEKAIDVLESHGYSIWCEEIEEGLIESIMLLGRTRDLKNVVLEG